MSSVGYDASVVISAAERAPTTAAVTAGWRSAATPLRDRYWYSGLRSLIP
jgi:hypothetical protein